MRLMIKMGAAAATALLQPAKHYSQVLDCCYMSKNTSFFILSTPWHFDML